MTRPGPHACDEDCICPTHQSALYYAPAADDHACQDPDCEWGSGGFNPAKHAMASLMSRRAATAAVFGALGVTLFGPEATAAADTYDPSTARALAIGAPESGWIESTAPSWDDDIATWNLRSIEERLTEMAIDLRNNLAALRPAPTRTIKIMCVGDSITTGTGSTDGHGYQTWLTDHLDRAGINATLTIQAYPGQTLRFVAPLAITAINNTHPDIVLIHLGTNDALQGDTADYQNRYGAFLDQILNTGPTIKACASRINYSRNPGTAAAEQALNTAILAASNARTATGRIRCADHTNVPSRWTVDGVHPSDAGYLRLTSNWVSTIHDWLPA